MKKIVAEKGTTIIIDKSTKTKILCINQNKKHSNLRKGKITYQAKGFVIRCFHWIWTTTTTTTIIMIMMMMIINNHTSGSTIKTLTEKYTTNEKQKIVK